MMCVPGRTHSEGNSGAEEGVDDLCLLLLLLRVDRLYHILFFDSNGI
jgi:hypothetical protein